MPTAQRTTHRPSGKPSWPSCLLSGVDHAGKSVTSALASASPLIGRTFWIEYGESTAEAYGALPGVDYEIVEHDGSYLDVLNAVRWASEQPRVDPDKPNLIVFDSASEFWSVLSEEQAIIARARRKKSEAEDVVITPDQWILAGSRFNKMIAVLRKHDGPSIVTARLKENMVMDARGNPTKDKVWEPEIQKKTRYALNLTIEMRGHREFLLTGSRDIGAFHLPKGSAGLALPDDFTFDGLWRRMGLDKAGATAPPRIVEGDAAAGVREQEGAEVAARGDDENVPLPSVETLGAMVKDIMDNAPEQPDVAKKALGLILSQHGDSLRRVGPFTVSGGEQVNGQQYLERARAHVLKMPKPQQEDRATSVPDGGDQPVTKEDRDASYINDDPDGTGHVHGDGDGREPHQEDGQPDPDVTPDGSDQPHPVAERAPETAREALEEHAAEVGQRIVEQGQAANATAAEQAAGEAVAKVQGQPLTGRAAWLDELAVHAEVAKLAVDIYARPALEACNAKTVDEIPDQQLSLWLASRRRPIASMMRKEHPEAAAKLADPAVVKASVPATRKTLGLPPAG